MLISPPHSGSTAPLMSLGIVLARVWVATWDFRSRLYRHRLSPFFAKEQDMLKRAIPFAILSLFVATVALGIGLSVTWTNATKNTDNSSIPATGPGSIASTTITYGTCNAAKDAIATISGTVSVAGAAQAGSVPNLAPGLWCAYAQHVNTFGVVSDPSNVGFKDIAAPKPGAPSNFSLN